MITPTGYSIQPVSSNKGPAMRGQLIATIAKHVNELLRADGSRQQIDPIIRSLRKEINIKAGLHVRGENGEDLFIIPDCPIALGKAISVLDEANDLMGGKFRNLFIKAGYNICIGGQDKDEPIDIEEFDKLLYELRRRLSQIEEERNPFDELIAKLNSKYQRSPEEHMIDVLL